jgi:hypothetical protein
MKTFIWLLLIIPICFGAKQRPDNLWVMEDLKMPNYSDTPYVPFIDTSDSSMKPTNMEYDSATRTITVHGHLEVDSPFTADTAEIARTWMFSGGNIHKHDDTIRVALTTDYSVMHIFPVLGDSQNILCDTANDRIITSSAGWYFPNFYTSVYSVDNTTRLLMAIFVNGEEKNEVHSETFFTTQSVKSQASHPGAPIYCSANDTITLRGRSDASHSFDFVYTSMSVVKIGE